ncbi:hypothetical protein [Mycobacterium sp.]
MLTWEDDVEVHALRSPLRLTGWTWDTRADPWEEGFRHDREKD